MTPADETAVLGDAPSALGRLHAGDVLPGQAGSTGVVRPAVDQDAGRRYAVKLVRGPVAGDRGVLAAARADARVQTELGHPRVARLHEFGRLSSGFYLLMEWLPGRSLDELL